MKEYKLSRRNEIRKALRPFGYEEYLSWRERRHAEKLLAKEARLRPPMGLESAKKLSEQKNLIFTVTAGRTGSKFLSRLLSIVPTVTSRHEPWPCFTWVGEPSSPAVARDFWLRYKLPTIAETHTPTYIETTHVAAKGFLAPLIQMGVRPILLAIRRSPRSVALSFLEKYSIPVRTWRGRQWLLHPEGPQALLPLPDWRNLTDYQLCFWYVLEMEERQRRWLVGEMESDVTVIDMSATDAHDFSWFTKLVEQLGVFLGSDSLSQLRMQHQKLCEGAYNKTNRRDLRFFGEIDRLEEEVWRTVTETSCGLRDWVEDRYGK